MTSGREESGSGEELHHSIKEWQAGGGQAALQEQPPDSRSPLHGMTAPGVNLHKEPEEKVEGFEEAEDKLILPLDANMRTLERFRDAVVNIDKKVQPR